MPVPLGHLSAVPPRARLVRVKAVREERIARAPEGAPPHHLTPAQPAQPRTERGQPAARGGRLLVGEKGAAVLRE
eukprot:5942917-Prymnesium_polylepis.2